MSEWLRGYLLVGGFLAIALGLLAAVSMTYWVLNDVYPWVPAGSFSTWRKVETVVTFVLLGIIVGFMAGLPAFLIVQLARRAGLLRR
jgi:hypothetical protein